jgi:D-arginine dehydrogenase
MGRDFDIVIVGGGIAGASLGAELAPVRRVLIVEAEDQCGYHSTGRSAAFYLESYGGPAVAPLTRASGTFLEEGGYLRRRGAVHLGKGEWPEVPEGVPSNRLKQSDIESLVPGVRPHWDRGLFEPGCADIDVARLHAAFLAQFRRAGGDIATASRVSAAERGANGWTVRFASGGAVEAALLVNAAGAWGDRIADLAGVEPLGLQPKRRTMIQLGVGRSGLKDLPLVDDWRGSFYFKGEGDRCVWLSPHDEADCEPCDAAAEEIDIAVAIDRFEGAVDWPVERVERSWAGLRTFAPDRIPVYGFDRGQPAFFWCVGQGGFGIQTAPAAARMAAGLILGNPSGGMVEGIDPGLYSPGRFASG